MSARVAAICLSLFVSLPAWGEQKVTVGDVDIHYIVLSTMDLDPDVASQYGIVRAPRKGFVNISFVSRLPPYDALSATVVAEVKNLLGQVSRVTLREISEPPARYYLESFDFSPEETLRFRFVVTLPDGKVHVFEHAQKMYVEE